MYTFWRRCSYGELWVLTHTIFPNGHQMRAIMLMCVRNVMLCSVTQCYVMLCYVMLCYVMLCYVMLCYVMLCYAMLCYVMLKRAGWKDRITRYDRIYRDTISREKIYTRKIRAKK